MIMKCSSSCETFMLQERIKANNAMMAALGLDDAVKVIQSIFSSQKHKPLCKSPCRTAPAQHSGIEFTRMHYCQGFRHKKKKPKGTKRKADAMPTAERRSQRSGDRYASVSNRVLEPKVDERTLQTTQHHKRMTISSAEEEDGNLLTGDELLERSETNESGFVGVRHALIN